MEKKLKRYMCLVLVIITLLTYIQIPNKAYGSTITFTGTTGFELEEAINNASSGDTIIITKDVKVEWNDIITIPTGKTITLTDNNSEVRFSSGVKRNEHPRGIFMINSGATLNIKGTGYNTFILDGGGIRSSIGYHIIDTQANSTLNMYDGVIITNLENYDYGVSGVYIRGDFNMYGGIITGITTIQDGAVTMISGTDQRYTTFNMYGGTISNNTNLLQEGTYAGGAAVNMNTFFVNFNMHGGKIINNFSYYRGSEGYLSLRTHKRKELCVFNHYGGIIADTYILTAGIVLSGASTVNVGSSISLNSTVTPADVTDKSLIWFSSNPNIASVDNFGVVTGVSSGTVIITATASDGSGVKATKTITVNSSITGITISGNSIVDKGNLLNLTATIVPSNASNITLTWTSSDNNIATVENIGNIGIVRGIKKGTVTITATAQDGSGVSANKVINVTSDTTQVEAKYILVDDIIKYVAGYSDTENDPKYIEEYKYIHNPYSLNGVQLDNTMGYSSFIDKWQDIVYTQFSKVGTYTIQYRVQDNPPTAENNNNFANYRYYSDAAENTIYVHRKPIVFYNINGSSVTDNSYDLDHSVSHTTKGIAKWEWQYVNSNGVVDKYTSTSKTDGVNKANSWLSAYIGVQYKLVLRVQDIEGAWSEPCLKTAGEISRPVADFVIDKNPMLYKTDTQKITDMSYDTNGLTLSYNWTVTKGGQTILNSTARDISSNLNQTINNLYLNVTGIYSISLKVTNSAGVQSDTVTKIFEVIVHNEVPTANFNLVSNENPAWEFPKILGLSTLKYRPSNSLFYEENARFDTYAHDTNTDNLGFVYDWKLERFAVKDINNISGAAANTYNYTTQFPFVNSFKGQGLPWGAYRITLSVTDKPPVPPYQSTDAKTATVTKNYYIVPEISINGSYESTIAEIMVGDTIKLKAKTSKYVEWTDCLFDGVTYNLNKVSEDSSFAYWEKEIVIPDTITESGTYNLKFVAKTTYGGNGNITREAQDNVPIKIGALKLINFRITNIVNHPHITFPYTKDMLVVNLIPYKTGYYVTFRIDSKGKPDNVYGRIDVGSNGSIEQIISMSKVESGDTEIWQGRFYVGTRLPINTVISIKLDCKKGTTVYDYNQKENWNGRSLIIDGSALMDGRINLTN